MALWPSLLGSWRKLSKANPRNIQMKCRSLFFLFFGPVLCHCSLSLALPLAKAKALKKFVEPLITKSKSDTTHNRRIVFSRIKQKNAVSELFRDVAVKVADRPGGYTRIIRLGNRLGDNAEMAMIDSGINVKPGSGVAAASEYWRKALENDGKVQNIGNKEVA